MRCIDLETNTLKIISTHFSYNEKLKDEKSFYTTVTNIQRVLKIWKMRNFTPEEKIVFFKTLAILNKKLHIFGIKSSPLCPFCNLCDETPLHIFYKCDRIKCLWLDLVQYFSITNFDSTDCHIWIS